jgi:hypothetical protein
MASNLNRPPAPDWWEQQVFRLTQRESQLQAEEQWLEEEQTVHFPARCQKRDEDYQQQEAELIAQSQARLKRAFFGNVLHVVRRGVPRPALTRTSEAINLDRGRDDLRRMFHQIHERDAQWIARQSSILRLKRKQLTADRKKLRDLADTYAVSITI